MKTLITILIFIIARHLSAQQPATSVLGKVDFNTLLKAVPELQKSSETAYAYACNKTIYCEGNSPLKIQYELFTEKKEFYAAQLQSNYAPQVDEFNATYRDDSYKKFADENDMIKSMGGMEKVMQMTDEEREVVTKKAMASKYTTSKTSSFSEAEIQRMMNDPEYAKQMSAKYNNMTQGEKQAMVNKKIASGDLNKSKTLSEEQLKEKEKAEDTKTINAFVLKTTTQLTQALETFNTKVSHIKNSAGNHEELDATYRQLYDKIPILENAVQGKYRDPIKLKKLNIDYALKHKDRGNFELSGVQVEQTKLKSAITEVISEYHSFLNTNGKNVNGKIINLFNGTNTELPLLKVEQHIISSIDVLASSIKTENELASKQEQHYQKIKTEN